MKIFFAMRNLLWCLACLVLAPAAREAIAGTRDRSALLDRYFGQGWADSDAGSTGVPPHQAAAVPDDRPPHGLHNMMVHMYITRKAYETYTAQYEGGELSRYIGDAAGSAPDPRGETTVVEGAFDEDKSSKNPWNEWIPQLNHFWDCREGPYRGFGNGDSAVNRAHKYFSGGFGMDGRYDDGWSENQGNYRGTREHGVLYLYKHGDKGKAYWYLGHVAHLLEDMTVPAHTLLWAHPYKGADAYETYMGDHYQSWSKIPSAPIEPFGTLYDLFYQTADVTNDFDAGSGPGSSGFDGEKDRGARRAEGFTPAQLEEEGDALMPLAYRRVAALYLYFYKQLDRTPPRVTLEYPGSGNEAAADRAAGSHVSLRARARDDLSGVDRGGYRFEYSTRTGASWSAWREASPIPTAAHLPFVVEPGRRYAFRVSGVDAAGNRARSAVKYLTAEPSGPVFVEKW